MASPKLRLEDLLAGVSPAALDTPCSDDHDGPRLGAIGLAVEAGGWRYGGHRGSQERTGEECYDVQALETEVWGEADVQVSTYTYIRVPKPLGTRNPEK